MNRLGIILAILLLLVTVNSMYYFLVISRVSIVEWLVFNACAPSSIAYLLGFAIFLATRDRTALHIAILPLFFFGGIGLYLFPWSGYNLIPQFSHIIMVLNSAWVLAGSFKTGDYKSAALGLLLSIILFSPFISFQQTYVYTHPEAFKKILGVGIDDFAKKFSPNMLK